MVFYRQHEQYISFIWYCIICSVTVMNRLVFYRQHEQYISCIWYCIICSVTVMNRLVFYHQHEQYISCIWYCIICSYQSTSESFNLKSGGVLENMFDMKLKALFHLFYLFKTCKNLWNFMVGFYYFISLTGFFAAIW